MDTEKQFSVDDKKYIREHSNVEIICRIKKIKKEIQSNKIP